MSGELGEEKRGDVKINKFSANSHNSKLITHYSFLTTCELHS
jgi:hypothetical protein